MASRLCWKCGNKAQMTPVSAVHQHDDSSTWYAAYTCYVCGAMSVAYGNDSYHKYVGQSAEVLDQRRDPPPRTWLPERALGKEFEDVPTNIGQAASEAYACYSIGSYRAASLMARSVVEATAKDKGYTTGTLAAKIKAMEDSRLINPALAQAAHEIRLIGNDAAHGDFMEAVDEEDCDDLLDFMSSLLEEVYQRPTTLARRQRQREERRKLARGQAGREDALSARLP